MRTPRIKAGVNNENNTSKCPHKPRTNPLMLICRPGVPSLLPAAFCSGGNGPAQKCKISDRKRIPQVCCSPARCCQGSGRGERPRISGDQRCHPSTPQPRRTQHRSIPGGSSDVDRCSLRCWLWACWKVACHSLSRLIKFLRQVRNSWKHLYNSQRLGSSQLPLQIPIFWLRRTSPQCPSTAQVGDAVGLVPVLTLSWTLRFLYAGGTWRHHHPPIQGSISVAKFKLRVSARAKCKRGSLCTTFHLQLQAFLQTPVNELSATMLQDHDDTGRNESTDQ